MIHGLHCYHLSTQTLADEVGRLFKSLLDCEMQWVDLNKLLYLSLIYLLVVVVRSDCTLLVAYF